MIGFVPPKVPPGSFGWGCFAFQGGAFLVGYPAVARQITEPNLGPALGFTIRCISHPGFPFRVGLRVVIRFCASLTTQAQQSLVRPGFGRGCYHWAGSLICAIPVEGFAQLSRFWRVSGGWRLMWLFWAGVRLEGARPGPIINPVRQVNHVWSASVGQGSYRTGYRSPMLEPKGNCSPVSKEPGGFGWQEGARLRQLEPDRRQLASHPQSPAGLRPRGFLFCLTTSTLSSDGSAPSPVRVGVGLGSVVLVLSCPLPVTPEPFLSFHQKPRKSSSPLSHNAGASGCS